MTWSDGSFRVRDIVATTAKNDRWAIVTARFKDSDHDVQIRSSTWPDVDALEHGDGWYQARVAAPRSAGECWYAHEPFRLTPVPAPVDLQTFAFEAMQSPHGARLQVHRAGRTAWSLSPRASGPTELWTTLPVELLDVLLQHCDDRQLASLARIDRATRTAAYAALSTTLQLNDEQLCVFLRAMRGENLLLTGPPGCGKSWVLARITARLRGCVTTASSGVAAIAIGGATLHSALGLGLGSMPIEALIRKHQSPKSKAGATMRSLTALVIDEVSLLTGKLLDLVVQLVSAIRKGRPWQLILVGDPMQLQPVDREGTGGLFFESRVVAGDATTSALVKPALLTEVVRQGADEAFKLVLAKLRFGRANGHDLRFLQDNSALASSADMPRLFCINRQADQYNSERLAEIDASEAVFNAHDDGDTRLLAHLRAPAQLRVRVGARVLLTANFHALKLANGSLGTVVDLNDASALTVRFDDGTTHTFEYHTFEVLDRQDKVVATRRAIPFALAFAFSVHKAQGLSFDSLYVDLSRAFAAGHAYVALSRVRSLARCFIVGLDARRINHVCSKSRAFCEGLAAN